MHWPGCVRSSRRPRKQSTNDGGLMDPPGIEPGSPACRAGVFPLDHEPVVRTDPSPSCCPATALFPLPPPLLFSLRPAGVLAAGVRAASPRQPPTTRHAQRIHRYHQGVVRGWRWPDRFQGAGHVVSPVSGGCRIEWSLLDSNQRPFPCQGNVNSRLHQGTAGSRAGRSRTCQSPRIRRLPRHSASARSSRFGGNRTHTSGFGVRCATVDTTNLSALFSTIPLRSPFAAGRPNPTRSSSP